MTTPLSISIGGRRIELTAEPTADPTRSVTGRSAGAGRRVLVVLNTPPTRTDHRHLRDALGLALADYLGELTYLESVPEHRLPALAADPLVRIVVDYRPEFKPRPVESRRTRNAAGSPAVARDGWWCEALLFTDADPTEAARTLQAVGATEVSVLDDRPAGGSARVRFLATEDVLAAAVEVDDVRTVDEVARPKLDGSPVGEQPASRGWADPLWSAGLNGSRQVAGMLDSPIDRGHCLFDDTRPIGPDHRKIVGFHNLVGEPAARHGTFVAGILAGDDIAAPGLHRDRGVAWAARISYGNSDDVERIGIFAALGRADSDGARIHTNSWHDEPVPQYSQLAADVDAFSWAHEDNLVVGSSGNDGEQLGPPGTAKNALCVSAGAGLFGAGPGNGTLGPSEDGRVKPDLVGPGCSVRSAVAGGGCRTEPDHVVFGVAAPSCASSWATPAVAGLAVLARQYYVDGYHPTGTPRPDDAHQPTAALLRATLLAGCEPARGDADYPSPKQGWGPVRLERVLQLPGAPRRLAIVDRRHAEGITTLEVHNHRFEVAGGQRPFGVTLVWTDPPGAPFASDPRVNQLELFVVPPDGGAPYFGNVLQNGRSVRGRQAERLDVVQRIVVDQPAVGTWSVRVRSFGIMVGLFGQGFALAVTGELG